MPDIVAALEVVIPASIPVKLAPLIAGNAPVKPDAAPVRVVAVHTPVKNTSPSGLIVHALPTLTFPEPVSYTHLTLPTKA